MAKFGRLFVGNLPWTVGHRQLKDYFTQFGPIASGKVSFDYTTGLTKGFGVVEFVNASDAEKATSQLEHILEGRRLTIREFKDDQDHQIKENTNIRINN